MLIISSPFKRFSLLAALVPVALLAGCANMVGTAPTGGNPFSNGAAISGTLHGGNVPIGGATIKLYAAGTGGYGSPATLYATTTSAANSNFAFTQVAKSSTNPTGIANAAQSTFGCPYLGDRQMYIIATGGLTQGPGNGTNSDAAFIVPLGLCSEIASDTFVEMNEVTTVATMAALQQYFNPNTESFGYTDTPATAQTQSAIGFANGVGTVNTLVNLSTGTANTTFTPTSSLPGAAVTATPETAKINTIANILAACVNSTSADLSNCGTLFANAVPPASAAVTSQPGLTFSNAKDTLQAAYFMLVNPTNSQDPTGKGLALYNLSTGVGAPFQTALSAQPTDWTIGVTYASTSTQSISATTPATTVGYLNEPEFLAVDATGNIWITNYVSSTASTTGYGNGMTELNPQGGITQMVLTGQNLLVGPRIPVIDPSGNVWVPNVGYTAAASTVGYGKTVVEFPVNGGSSSGNVYNVAGGPFAVASDGAGNIYVAETTKSVANTGGGNGTPGADVEKIPAGSPTGTTATVISPSGSGYAASTYAAMAVDSNFNVWVTSDAKTLAVFSPPSTGTTYTSTSTMTNLVDSVGIAIDSSNTAWVSNYAAVASAATDTFTYASGAIAAGTTNPIGIANASYTAIDGAGNTWTTGHPSGGAGSIGELSNAGTSISPSAGFVHTLYYPTGVAIDPTGNVWIGTEAADTKAATPAGTNGPGGAAAGGYVTEIVGSAVPVITPIVAGLPATAGGTNKLATKP